jgi:hypothetical protein
MRRITPCLTAGLLVWWIQPVLAEPAWTREGDCASCHTTQRSDLISVFGHDATADPNHHGSFKLFRAPRNTTKSMYLSAGGLTAGDQYAFAVKGFRYGGIATGATFTYGADCDWSNWGGAPGTYSYNEFFLKWGVDPSSVSYDVAIGSTTVYDYYDLTFMVAGRSSTGELFYAEEHAYLQVRPPNTAPLVSIVSPVAGAIIQGAPLDITITANASDPGGSVTKVEFYANSTKVGEDTTAPYEGHWLQVAKGSYVLTAKATDNDGSTTTSAAVNITVKGVPGDFDSDSDVDQTDFGHLQLCMSGGQPLGSGCGDADLTGDNQVNSMDIVQFVACMSGPGVQAEPACAN